MWFRLSLAQPSDMWHMSLLRSTSQLPYAQHTRHGSQNIWKRCSCFDTSLKGTATDAEEACTHIRTSTHKSLNGHQNTILVDWNQPILANMTSIQRHYAQKARVKTKMVAKSVHIKNSTNPPGVQKPTIEVSLNVQAISKPICALIPSRTRAEVH